MTQPYPSELFKHLYYLLTCLKDGRSVSKSEFGKLVAANTGDNNIEQYWQDYENLELIVEFVDTAVSIVRHFDKKARLENENVSMNGLRKNLTREINTLTRALDDHATYEETAIEALRDVQHSVSILNIVYDDELPGKFDELDIEVIKTPYANEVDL